MLNRNDDQFEAKKLMLLCMAAASLVMLLFLVAIYMHDSKKPNKKTGKEVTDIEVEEPKIEVGRSNLVSEDLDFWDMYDGGEKKPIEDLDKNKDSIVKKNKQTVSEKTIIGSSNKNKKETDKDDEEDDEQIIKKDQMDDGKHVKVMGQDGKAAWYDILSDVKKNTYDFNEYLTYDNGFLKYNAPDVKTYIGADLSSKQGTVDFDKVKRAGIDYVMLKVAGRGYETGQISIDEKFVEYAQGAIAAGLPIGVYFNSQAVNEIEAVEEANFTVSAANNIIAKYPIAIDLTEIKNDSSRTDKLTAKERTAVVKKFCDTVKAFGKTPVICASRDFLITEINLSDLTDYDIWLKDEAVTADYMRRSHSEADDDSEEKAESEKKSKGNDKKTGEKIADDEGVEAENSFYEERPEYIGTDFPYDFTLWQYTEKGTVNGINSSVNLNLSFVNYAEK